MARDSTICTMQTVVSLSLLPRNFCICCRLIPVETGIRKNNTEKAMPKNAKIPHIFEKRERVIQV